MIDLNDYKISTLVSYVKNCEGVISCYNWKNGESVDFFEKDHPAYRLFNQEKISDIVAKEDWVDDLNWLIETNFIIPIAENDSEKICLPESSDFLHLIMKCVFY